MSAFSVISSSMRLVFILPAQILKAVFSSLGRSINFIFASIQRGIDLFWDGIVYLARGTSWLRKRTGDLIFLLFSLGAVVLLFAMPYLLAFDPLNFSRAIGPQFGEYVYWGRMVLAFFFLVCCIMFLKETFEKFNREKLAEEVARTTWPETFFRLISDGLSWLIFIAVALYFLLLKLNIRLDFSDFPNRLPSFNQFLYVLNSRLSDVFSFLN